MKIANLTEANAVLAQFIPKQPPARTVYKLDTIRALLSFLGEPQNSLKIIHVAGTSGKTSTSYFAAALLRAAGKRVGLTVSPHIEGVNERVQIDGTPLPEAVFCKSLEQLLDEVKRSGLKPTYFELLVTLAYWEFARQKVDYAVVEVGLGGLLDGTNVVTREDKVCVITDIGFDHVNILGSTLKEIARQKAGIIQSKNNVFVHPQTAEVMDETKAVCQQKQAILQVIEQTTTPPELSFLPLYQQRNFSLAQAAVEYVLQRDGETALTPPLIEQAAHVHIPGRMEVFHLGRKATVILDGAHNPQKLQTMAASIKAQYPETPIAVLAGLKPQAGDLPANARTLSKLATRLITTTFGPTQEHGQPSIDAETLAAACRQAGATQVTAIPDHYQALAQLLRSPEPLLLVTGSLYLISYLRPQVIALCA